MNVKYVARCLLLAFCLLVILTLGGWNALYTILLGLILYFLFLVFEEWVDNNKDHTDEI